VADGYGSPSPGDRVIFIIAGHQYRTNFGIGHSIKEMLNAELCAKTEGQFNLPKGCTIPITTRCTSSCLYTWQR